MRTTDQIADQTLLNKDGHNLARWIKELRVPASIAQSVPHFRLAKDGAAWDVEKAHQAWRYGVRMQHEDEKVLVTWLERLCQWVKEEINR